MADLSIAKAAVKEAKERGKSRRTEYRKKQQAAAKRGNYQSIWSPQYAADGRPGPQVALVTCPDEIGEILFGGARGGGKTDGALGAWLIHANRYGEHAKGVFFRRRFKQLEEVQNRCSMLFPKLGATFTKGEAMWVFPNGATLKLRHLWDEYACEEYQGHAYTFLVFEELTNWASSAPIDKMRATLRNAHGVPSKIICTANPGGSGHNWVKARYITPCPKGYMPIKDLESGELRIFIPSKLEDNRALFENDPNYERRLLQSGNAALVKAWRFGDWDVIAGGFMDDLWNPDKHILPVFEIPQGWRFRRSFDWGSASPASLGIWAISDGSPVRELGGMVFPRGSMIRIDEWYTCQHDAAGNIRPNEGMRLTNLALGAGIAHRAAGRNYSGCVADPSVFAQPGRQSIYSEMQIGAREVGHNLLFNPANNDRVAGWQKVRDMLENALPDTPEKPGLYTFETCIHYIRTLPVIQRDEKKPDDIDTDQEDHCLHGDTLVETRAGPVKISDLVGTTGELLSTDDQWQTYFDCRRTRRSAPCVRVVTADGRSVIATPDHRVLTHNGWVEAKDLLGEIIVTSKASYYNNPLHQEGFKASDSYSDQQHDPGVSGRPVLPVRSVFSEGWRAFARQGLGNLERAGAGWLARSPQGREPAQQPAGQPGSPAWAGAPFASYEPAGSRGEIPADHGREGAAGRRGVAWLKGRARLALQALSGAHRPAQGRDGGLRLLSLRQAVSAVKAGCQEVGLLLQQLQVGGAAGQRRGQRDQNLPDLPEAVHGQQVQQVQNVQPDLCGRAPMGSEVVAVEPAGQHDVYNLEVAETHAFAVNGGLIVHNCVDEVRYCCMTGGRGVVEGSFTGH